MKKITNSFIRNIVRQSLNENYGLLNEQVEPYSITLTKAIGGIPAGTVLPDMTVPEKPDGGFSIFEVDDVEKLSGEKSREGLFDICSKYPSQMGTPLVGNQTITSTVDKMMVQLTDIAIDADTILNGLKTLSDFASFCKANQYSKIVGKKYNRAKDLKSGILRDDGAESMFNDDQGDYYNLIGQALENSIQTSKQTKLEFIEQAKAKYKIVTDKAAADKLAAEKLAAETAAKAAEDAANLAKIGGAGLEGFMIDHPTLIASSVEQPSGPNWNARVYLLDTGIKTIDNFYYGEIVKDGVPLAVKFRNDVLTEPLTLDPDTDWRLKYGISQSDTWEYDDVIISDDGKSIALTTDPVGEEKFTNESYRHKGFRHNLLTEIELKYDKNKPQTGVEVGDIQKKLNLPLEKNPTFGTKTLAAVINHQKTEGTKLNPPLRTDGVVDDATYASIMAIQPPPFELSAAKKSKGDDVTLIQKQLGAKGGTFGTDTETKVKEFQTNYGTTVTPALRTDGVVDQATFDLIKKFKGPNSRKVFSGVKTNYEPEDWIIITPNKGVEGNIFIDKKYFKIKSVSPNRMTVVLDLEMKNTDLKTPEEYKTLKVGGMTAKVLFGTEAEGLTKNAPIANNNRDNRDNNSGTRSNTSNSGTRSNTSNSGTNTVNTEKQKQRNVRRKEYCDTLRQIKQYINNNKGGDLTINCQYTPKTRNQIMMALTGGTIVNPATTVDQPQYNVVKPESSTNQLL